MLIFRQVLWIRRGCCLQTWLQVVLRHDAMILLGTWRAWAMQGFILAGGTRDLINHGEQIVERPESLEDMPGPRRKEKRSPRPYKTAWAPTPKLGIGPNFVRISTRPKPEKKVENHKSRPESNKAEL